MSIVATRAQADDAPPPPAAAPASFPPSPVEPNAAACVPEPNVAPVVPNDAARDAMAGPPSPEHVSVTSDMPVARPACEARGAAVDAELSRHHHTLSKQQAKRAARALCHEAERSHLDPLLLLAVIGVESSFNPQAISPVGAEGLMQLMPHTGEYLAARANLAWSQRVAFDPAINIRIGTRYLATLRDAFHGRMDWALTAYNRGPSATHHILRAHHGLPREVRASYASRVLNSYERLKRSYASAS